MAILAGIDEAGFGPVLGPLVVSAVSFAAPDEMDPAAMWTELSAAVCKKPSRKSGKIAIGDSKKLFVRQKADPLKHLERGVLAMLSTRQPAPESLGGLLAQIAPAAAQLMPQYPWYAEADLPLPRSADQTDLKLAANALRLAMAGAGIRLLAMRAEPVFVRQYNTHVTATNNKSTALFDVTSRLLDWLWRNSPPGLLRIYVDRQGGRMRYLPSLQRVFAGCSFKILDETNIWSAYRITGRQRTCEICFITGAESKWLPVALASMTSKYLRELFMEMLNGFWTSRVPGLSPTAGYYTDGRRFYKEIAPAAGLLKVDSQMLYRCR